MAGAIAEIAYKTMFKNFRRIKPERSNIYLIEALPRILSIYPEKLSLRAEKDDDLFYQSEGYLDDFFLMLLLHSILQILLQQ